MKKRSISILIVSIIFIIFQSFIYLDLYSHQNEPILLKKNKNFLVGNLSYKEITFVKDDNRFIMRSISSDALDGYNNKYIGDFTLFTNNKNTYPYSMNFLLFFKIHKIITYKVFERNSNYYFSYSLTNDE